MLKPKTPAPPASLDERIAAIHAEIDALIEAKAAELKKVYEGTFSQEVLVHDIKIKAWGCPCKIYQIMQSEQN
jgi:hypothetical protein